MLTSKTLNSDANTLEGSVVIWNPRLQPFLEKKKSTTTSPRSSLRHPATKKK